MTAEAPGKSLLLSELGLANVGKKSRMGSATLGEMRAGVGQTEGAVYREPDIRGVFVLLPVILPPANRAKGHRLGRFQRFISAAWAAKTGLHASAHERWTVILACGFT